jgi:hypothetical protein
LSRISTAQTLNIEEYIKNQKVTMLFDSFSTHNFMNFKVVKLINCFIFLALEYQVIIVDGGTINCLGKFHSIKGTMGEYLLYSPMIEIQMGGFDVVLGVQWLQSLGTMALNFQYLFMIFSLDAKEIELRGIHWKPYKVISSNIMRKVLKRGHRGVIANFSHLMFKNLYLLLH